MDFIPNTTCCLGTICLFSWWLFELDLCISQFFDVDLFADAFQKSSKLYIINFVLVSQSYWSLLNLILLSFIFLLVVSAMKLV